MIESRGLADTGKGGSEGVVDTRRGSDGVRREVGGAGRMQPFIVARCLYDIEQQRQSIRSNIQQAPPGSMDSRKGRRDGESVAGGSGRAAEGRGHPRSKATHAGSP